MLGAGGLGGAEYLRAHLFGGFPWIPLGNAVVTLLPLAQLASLVGVYGLSLLVALVHAGFALAALTASRAPAWRRWQRTAAARHVAVSLWGGRASATNTLVDAKARRFAVGLIQGNVPQEEKWDPARAGMIFERYLALTATGGRRVAREFILWPESATPFYFEEDPLGPARSRSSSSEIGHAAAVRHRRDRTAAQPAVLQLGLHARSTAGATAAVYRKIFLVPFGEYVPFRTSCSSSARSSKPSRLSRRATRHDAAGRRAHGEHGDLLRGRRIRS